MGDTIGHDVFKVMKKILPRMHLRIPTRMAALLVRANGTAKTMVHELSAGGCLIESSVPLEKGEEVSVAGTFETGTEKIFRGHVLYCVPDDGRIDPPMLEGMLVGVRFVDLDDGERKFLDRVVRDNRFKMFRRISPRNQARA